MNWSRCPKCPGNKTLVCGDGPTPCRTMAVAEMPGREENNFRRPFSGRSGQELNERLLPLAHTPRDQIYFTNTVKCWFPDGLDVDKQADRDIIEACAHHHLPRELSMVRPEVVVTMGSLANKIMAPWVVMDVHRGFPVEGELWGYRRTFFPTYHPAAGMHQSSLMLPLREDFERLGMYLRGELRVPVDEYPEPEYVRVRDPWWFEKYLEWTGDSPLATDTEYDPSEGNKPHCFSMSVQQGTGLLILAEDKELVRIYGDHIRKRRGPILMHNLMADVPVFWDMGVQMPLKRIVDTMVDAYHAANQPQGLKPLAWRLAGMEMKDFDDVVHPHWYQRIVDWVLQAGCVEWPATDKMTVPDGKGGWKEYKPQSLNTKFKRMITDMYKNAEVNPLDRFDKWTVEEIRRVHTEIGPPPNKSIIHVPEDELIHYACRDSDATLRIWPIIKRIKREITNAVRKPYWRVA